MQHRERGQGAARLLAGALALAAVVGLAWRQAPGRSAAGEARAFTPVPNGGFEQADAEGKAPAGWILGSPPGGEFAWDEQVAHTGRRSARVRGIEPGKMAANRTAVRCNVPAPPPGDYFLLAWARAQDAQSGAGFDVLLKDDKGEVVVNQHLSTFDGTFEARDGKVIGGSEAKGEHVVFRYQDETPVAGRSYYYLRVLQEDTHMAWSSPVWVEVAK